MRISGGRHLASLNIDLIIIQLMARWGSWTIMRYVADAPLSRITEGYVKNCQDIDSLRDVASDALLNGHDDQARLAVKKVESQLESLTEEFGLLKTITSRTASTPLTGLIIGT